MTKTLFDLANRHQVYLERLKAGLVRDYVPAQAELRQAIVEVLGALGIENMQELDRRELEKVLIQLRAAHVEVMGKAMDAFAEELPALAAYSAGLEASTLGGLTGLLFNAPTAKLAYQAALQNPVQATGQLLADMISSWPEADALKLANVTRTGWAQGRTLHEMMIDLTGKKVRKGAGYVYEGGQLDISRQHAGTLIHTTSQHTASAARMDVWERNNDIVKGYQWVSTLDRRTTQQCKSLDGRKFEAGKGPLPPIHPNCRSTTVADLGPEFDWLDEGATRASAGTNPGYVAGDLSYYEWLKTQPAAFQDIALGRQRAKLFRDGGLTADAFGKLNLGRNFEPLTLAQMKTLAPDAFKLAGL